MAVAATLQRAASALYAIIATTLLGSWTLVALGMTALSAANKQETSLVGLTAPPTLLVYLVSKLVVTLSPSADRYASGSLAAWVATADYGSPQGALVLFLLGVAWLKALVPFVVLLVILTSFAAVLFFAAGLTSQLDAQVVGPSSPDWLPDALVLAADPVVPMVGATGVASASASSMAASATETLTERFAEIEAETGVDIEYWVEMFPPRVILLLTLALWLMVASLGLYVASKTLGGLRRVLSASPNDWASRGRSPSLLAPTPAPAETATVVREVRIDAAGFDCADGPVYGARGPADGMRDAWSNERPGHGHPAQHAKQA